MEGLSEDLIREAQGLRRRTQVNYSKESIIEEAPVVQRPKKKKPAPAPPARQPAAPSRKPARPASAAPRRRKRSSDSEEDEDEDEDDSDSDDYAPKRRGERILRSPLKCTAAASWIVWLVTPAAYSSVGGT